MADAYSYLKFNICVIMLREINISNYLEPGYLPGAFEVTDSVKTVIQKIKMILFTRQGEILGDTSFGMSLEDLLFEFKFSKSELNQKFGEQLANYVPESSDFEVRFEVNFVPGTVRDLAYIDIYVNGTKAFGMVAE